MNGDMGSRTFADFVVQFGEVNSSSLDSTDNAVLYSVSGAGAPEEPEEVDPSADVFGALGVLGRPLPPQVEDGKNRHAEVVCVRTASGLVPMAARDLRLKMGGDGPNEGTVAMVGYGGGFHSLDAVLDSNGIPLGTIHAIYCPYEYSGGVAQKAHIITLDPSSGNEHISIVHATGQAILMQNDGLIRMQSPDGQSFVQVEDGKVTISADVITLKGSVFVGGVETAVPLLAGTLSQPCARLFISTP